ncbi:MAG: hypothetical protein ACOCZK_00035 [Planctomycetota bacterium]
MNAAQSTPLFALALLAGAGALVMASQVPEVSLGPPSTTIATRVVDLEVRLEPIRSFPHYYGGEKDGWRDRNPFLPWLEQQQEIDEIARQESDGEGQRRPEPVPQRQQKPPPPEPVFDFVELDEDVASRPRVMGMTGGGERSSFLVTYGNTHKKRMQVGERIAGWTLKGVMGQFAVFVDPDGSAHRLIIGTEPGTATEVRGDSAGSGSDGDDQLGSITPDPDGGRTRRPRTGDGTVGEELPDEDDLPSDPAALEAMLDRYAQQYPALKRALQANPGLRAQILANPRQFMQLGRRYSGQ